MSEKFWAVVGSSILFLVVVAIVVRLSCFGYVDDQSTHSIVTYYITRTGHITVRIPVDEYTAKYKVKERDKKLESIGI